MQVQAELTTDEGIKVAPFSAARIVGRARFMTWYPTVGALIGIFVGGLLSGILPVLAVLAGWRGAAAYLPMIVMLAQLVGIAIGMAVGWNKALKRHQRDFIAGVQKRGTPETAPFTYSIGDEALTIESPRVRHVIAWPAVAEVFPSPDHWLVQQDTMTYNLPKRAFASADEERAFLAALLERLTPEARARSVEAAALAG